MAAKNAAKAMDVSVTTLRQWEAEGRLVPERTAGRQTVFWVNLALLTAVAIYALNPLIAPAQWAANVAYWMEAVF
jgi:hypothetical protein